MPIPVGAGLCRYRWVPQKRRAAWMDCSPVLRLGSWPPRHLAAYPCAHGNGHQQTGAHKELKRQGWHWLLLTHVALGCCDVGRSLPVRPSPSTHPLSCARDYLPSGQRASPWAAPGAGDGVCSVSSVSCSPVVLHR